jgi:hypothetical protein
MAKKATPKAGKPAAKSARPTATAEPPAAPQLDSAALAEELYKLRLEISATTAALEQLSPDQAHNAAIEAEVSALRQAALMLYEQLGAMQRD